MGASDSGDGGNEPVETTDRSQSYGRVEIRAFDAGALRTAIPTWDRLGEKKRLAALQLVNSEHEQHVHNTVCIGKHEFCIDGMDRNQSVTEKTISLAVGDDNSTAPAYADRSLNNERYRTTIADSNDEGADITYTTLVSATEANAMDKIRELGVVLDVEKASGETESHLLNHTLIDPEPKNSDVAITVRNTLGFEGA